MQCLCLYAQEFSNFRIDELKSICELFAITIDFKDQLYNENRPYLILDVGSLEDAEKILSRSVLMKSMCILYSHGESFSKIGYGDLDLQKKVTDCFTSSSDTFKFEVDVFNKKITLEDRVSYIEEIQKYVNIPGDIDLKKPSVVFSLMIDFEADVLQHFYFGKLIGLSQRNVIHKYNLKTRYFIGNTSMDPQLALVMANQAQVEHGSFCYDPFVGTGSIILACSHFGGFSGGNDIDYNIIYGRGKSSRAGNKNFRAKDEIISTNYENYGIRKMYWDIIAGDATKIPFRVTEIFDVIITDPPYGIREGGRKLGSKKDTTWVIPEDIHDEHIPAKKMHTLSNVIMDLLDFAFKYLVYGGRLVYWLPIYKPRYSDEVVPKHPGLQLRANSEQGLSKTVSRRLITMVKVKHLHECESCTTTNSLEWIQMQDDFRKNYFTANSESSHGGETS